MITYITEQFADVETVNSFGYMFFFYRDERKLPFATLLAADYPYDHVSHLDRPGVYRLNIGVSKQTFQALFGSDPVDSRGYDFTALDTLMPHPDYAAQSFVCVLNPGHETLIQVQSLLAEAYALAVRRYARRARP